MDYLTLLTKTGSNGTTVIIFYVVILVAFFYFMIIRPQKKQNAQQEELMKGIKPGDSIMTTSGFYGVVIDVTDDETVIVEFGNNKNCRIPMHKKAIAEVESPADAVVTNDAEEEKVEETTKKKGLFGKAKKDDQ
ncbi:MAG: preprotein translocase subunit YajC [Lachnospiraceae bacterium]|nr:preprotein translocase subunit YajC [Lachnospiraceae bacterium]